MNRSSKTNQQVQVEKSQLHKAGKLCNWAFRKAMIDQSWKFEAKPIKVS